MAKNKKIIIASGVILITGIAVFAFLHQFSAPQKTVAAGLIQLCDPPPVPPLQCHEERIVINLTTTEGELIPKLKEQGYIRSEWAFNFVLEIKGWQGKIEPGGYIVSKGMNAWELADKLVNHPYQKWVVIPEGLRVAEIGEKLQKELGWDDHTRTEFFLNSREGYLFPDTYLFNLDITSLDALSRMENQFNEKVAELFKEAAESNIKNDTLMVLASIVQREAANEQDMPLIAGVIWNRWLEGMPFEIDATIQYALGKPGNWWPVIKPEDYKLDSPYNTYIHKGRPPTPICNPGLAAINAVINSEDSDYFYYLHDSEGQIHPAKTYEEHLKNIREYFWNGYKDEKLGYEMKYPPSWSIAEERKDFGIELSRTVFQSKDYQEIESEEYKEIVAAGEETGLLQPTVMSEGVNLEFLITGVPSVFKWQDWAERATDYPYGKIVSERFIILEGKKVYERQVESGEITSIVISFPDSEETKLFELILHTLKKDEDKNSEILKQIISTFNF